MISVIVPVFNVEKYLEKCLDSIINQTYKDLEILVIDDGSTDDSSRICDEYEKLDERVKVYHTENHGLSAARNYALDRINGEWVSFVDSDDWLDKNAIQILINVAKKTQSDIVTCRYFQEYIGKTYESLGPKGPFIVEGEEILKSLIIDNRITSDVWNKLYNATLFSSIRFPEGLIFEDIATTYRILQVAYRLEYIPDCLIHYRNRENSLSNVHSMKSLVDYWVVYYERYIVLGSISQDYYRKVLAECINAISRMWRWYAGCTEEEKQKKKALLNEMQHFVKDHRGEVLKNTYYSAHVKATCFYTLSKSSIVFEVLYIINLLYRNRNREMFFGE